MTQVDSICNLCPYIRFRRPPNMSRRSSVVGLVVIPAVIAVSLFSACAGSNANRASRDAAAELRWTSTTRDAAEQLANSMMANPTFQAFRREAIEAEPNSKLPPLRIAVMLPPKIDADDYTGDFRKKVDEFLQAAKAVLANRGVAVLREVEVRDGRYVRSEEEGRLDGFDSQDVDEAYNQETGKVSTQGKGKAVLAMQITGKRDKVPARGGGFIYDYILRIELFDVVDKTMFFSDDVPLTQN